MSWFRLVAPLAYTAFLFTLSATPDTEGYEGSMGRVFLSSPPSVQNLLHVPAFGLLGFLWVWALLPRTRSVRLACTLAFALAAGYGVFDELHQMAVPGRYTTVSDALLNFVGVAIAILICRVYVGRKALC